MSYVEVPLIELQEIKKRLEDSLRWINDQLSKKPPQGKTKESVPKVSKTKESVPKAARPKSLGICMFVNKKVLKDQEICTREQLENCSQKCTSKAIHVKNGLLVCGRHKDSDTSKIEEIVNTGTLSVIRTIDLTEADMIEETGALKPGKYGLERRRHLRDVSSEEYVEAAIEECALLETFISQSERIIPVRINLKELLVAQFEGVSYVIDPLGDCFGKIVDQTGLTALETKMKTKEFGVVQPFLVPLEGARDREFLERFCLEYSLEYLQ
jgi:hypothetical protein